MTRYQFQVDRRPGPSPVRNRWEVAAQDAVDAGYAHWSTNWRGQQLILHLSSEAGAEIVRIENLQSADADKG